MMDTYKFTSHNESDTIELAQNLESEKFPNMVICLDGELGSGKTFLQKLLPKPWGLQMRLLHLLLIL